MASKTSNVIVKINIKTERLLMPARPVIKITATKVDQTVCLEFGNAQAYFGTLCMSMNEYTAFTNTLLTGSGASGDEGCEVVLIPEGF